MTKQEFVNGGGGEIPDGGNQEVGRHRELFEGPLLFLFSFRFLFLQLLSIPSAGLRAEWGKGARACKLKSGLIKGAGWCPE